MRHHSLTRRALRVVALVATLGTLVACSTPDPARRGGPPPRFGEAPSGVQVTTPVTVHAAAQVTIHRAGAPFDTPAALRGAQSVAG